MKKVFSLIAAALMSMSMNAQTWSFAGEVAETDEAFAADANWEWVSNRWNYQPALTNAAIMLGDSEWELTKGLKFTAGKANSSKEGKIRRNTNMLQLNGKDITIATPKLKAGYKVEVVWKTGSNTGYNRYLSATNLTDAEKFEAVANDNGVATDDTDKGNQTGTGTVAADGVVIFKSEVGGINVMSITIKDAEGNVMTPEQIIAAATEGEPTTIASWVEGTANGGTWEAMGSVVIGYEAKYNKNTTKVQTITFPNGILADGAITNALKLSGDFKVGDVITIQPFTGMSATDFTGGSKYATILLYDAEVNKIADLTGSAAGALTVTDGHEEEGTPKEFTYTLGKDYSELYFGRGGGTRINLMKVTVTRTVATDAIQIMGTDNVKTDNRWYNMAGQEVAAPAKGLYIRNGKKMLVK